jgi:hypothetical protein
MTDETRRNIALQTIRQNIAHHGHHLYIVSGGPDPRSAYTIGLSETLGHELLLAGALSYMIEDVRAIVRGIAEQLRRSQAESGSTLLIPPLGFFVLRETHPSWASELALGAFDYYGKGDIGVLQIIPDEAHWTVDIPDMSIPWSATSQPIWQWLRQEWTLPIPRTSHATTNLAALRGEFVTEAARWEDDYWELFAGAGPDVTDEERRVVPLGTLLGADPSLSPVVQLPVGDALWREQASDWHPWLKPY